MDEARDATTPSDTRTWTFGIGAHVRCVGKGRKSRCTPFCRDVVAILEAFGCRDSQTHPLTPSFRALGVDASVPMPCQRLVARHTATACQVCASLSAKTVTPHTLRHAAAMALLRRGVDLTVIALWLGPRINGVDRGVLAMRTCGSKSARSLMPPHPASFPIAIGLPIRCWPSSML